MNLADALNFAEILPGSVVHDRLELQRAEIKAYHEKQQADFERKQVNMLPLDWQRKTLTQHRKLAADKGFPAANQWLLEFAERLSHCRIVPNTTDADIRDIANAQSERAQRYVARCQVSTDARQELDKLCQGWQIDPPDAGISDVAAIARMLDPLWWRRKLRRVHACQLENLAREIGEVGKGRGLFLSNESFERYKRQCKRNRNILERTEAISEDGEILTLAEIADSTVSNPAHRRGETMTRINGIEELAREVGLVADFVTLTCPSRMHRRLESGADNPKFDGSTARQARNYLQEDLWENIRAKLHRQGITAIGLRVCEPHHDGTPHWHLIIFVWPHQVSAVRNIITEYALRDNPDEAGAQKYRVKFEAIDYARGSGAGYVAKYVSKNIDAFGLNPDLLGDMHAPDENAARAVAWSRTHGIRQFQFFGAAPIGLWRELRRIPKASMAGAPQALLDAWDAAQKEGSKRASYGAFLMAIGGLGKKAKDLLIGLAKKWCSQLGRYGDQVGWKPAGIVSSDEPQRVYPSERKVWTVIAKNVEAVLPPWTRVNNCTRASSAGSKEGRFFVEMVSHPPDRWPISGELMQAGT
jgi:hypothetical protein